MHSAIRLGLPLPFTAYLRPQAFCYIAAMNQPAPQMTHPFGVPQFSADAAHKRRGRGLTKALGVVLLVIALFGMANHLMTISMVFGGNTVTMDWLPGMTPELKKEIARMQQEQMDFILARWSFWAFGVVELIISIMTLLAAVFLLRSRLKGINWTKMRVIAVFLSLPLWGYESFALIDLSFQQQERMLEVQLRAQKGTDPARAQEAMDKMKPFMRASGYGGMIIGGIIIGIINGVLLLLVTRPQVREYLELAESGGDSDIPVHFDAAMGLPMMPPPQMGLGPGGETVHLPPQAMGPGAPTVAIPPQPKP